MFALFSRISREIFNFQFGSETGSLFNNIPDDMYSHDYSGLPISNPFNQSLGQIEGGSFQESFSVSETDQGVALNGESSINGLGSTLSKLRGRFGDGNFKWSKMLKRARNGAIARKYIPEWTEEDTQNLIRMAGLFREKNRSDFTTLGSQLDHLRNNLNDQNGDGVISQWEQSDQSSFNRMVDALGTKEGEPTFFRFWKRRSFWGFDWD